MLKTTPRGSGAHPRPPRSHRGPLQTTNHNAVHKPEIETPRSVRMMERLRDGLGEYIRLYNPVSTSWRRMNNLQTRESGRHTVDLGAHPSNLRSETSDDEYFNSSKKKGDKNQNGGVVPRLHILHSDSESEDDNVSNDVKGSVRSMPNLKFHGGGALTNRGDFDFMRTPRVSDASSILDSYRTPRVTHSDLAANSFRLHTDRSNLSGLSSEDDDQLYTSRRENMRAALKLMGPSKDGKTPRRTPRKKRPQKPRPVYSTDESGDSASEDYYSQTGDHTHRRSHRGPSLLPLDVITERQRTEDEMFKREKSSPTKRSGPSTREGDNEYENSSQGDVFLQRDSRDDILAKRRGSRAQLQQSLSRRSIDAEEPGPVPMSKRNSVAQLRAKRRRSSSEFLQDWFTNQTGPPNGKALSHRKNSRAKFELKVQMLAAKFKRICKFFIILYRLWKSHSANVAKMIESFDSLDAIISPEEDQNKLMFDVSYFKTSDEAKIPLDAKTILQLKPDIRTAQQIKYLKTALRNYQVIADYPIHMQQLIAERAWYEGYDQKRVMVREGHPPQNFYFILSGSVVVTRYDAKQDTNKTVCFMGRGDAFGELAIVNGTTRDSTVITKEAAQFLVLRDEDFLEIFTSGGLSNPKDPFLNSLWYLRGWPLKKLADNPKARFRFFRRGFVIAPNTNETQWIYIVKSGSLSLYKKLKFESPDASKPRKEGKKKRRVKRKKKPKLDKLYAEHEDQVKFNFDRQISSLEHTNHLRQMQLQPIELNIPTNPVLEAYKKTQKGDLENPGIVLEKDATSMTTSGVKREQSTVSLSGGRNKKVSFTVQGPILTKSNMDPNPPEEEEEVVLPPSAPREVDLSRMAVLSESVSRYDQKGLGSELVVPRHKLPMFVVVQTLTKGSYFGLNAMVYKTQKQPEFSLVSNGAEVIMIDKRFFEDNCSQRLFTEMRESIYPFPMDDVLQDMLKRTVNWDHNCKDTFTKTLHRLQIKNADVHDARSTLLLSQPPEMPPRPT